MWSRLLQVSQTLFISDDGDAQPNGNGAEAIPDGLARPIGHHEGVAGSGVAVDDIVSIVGFLWEVGDSADCRELLKDIERVVHDDDDAGSAEAHDSVAGSAKFTLKKDGAEFGNIARPTPDLSRLNIKPCISHEFAAALD